jgi:CDP-diacylglycerol--glycerol-3-phosphate 3-phosphatidyltransferase
MDLSNWKEAARRRLRPLVLTLDRWGISPLAVSIAGTVIALLGAWMVAEGLMLLGTLVFLIGSACDMLDGALARLQGSVSRRGAFLDSVLDRFGEAGYLTGAAIWYMHAQPDSWLRAVILVLVVMFGALATSYVRARAEGVGETCTVGVLQRTERVIILGLGGLLGHVVLYGMLWVLALLTLVTTIQRIVHVAAKLPGPPPPAERTRETWDQPEPAPAAAPPAEPDPDAPTRVEPTPPPEAPPETPARPEPTPEPPRPEPRVDPYTGEPRHDAGGPEGPQEDPREPER